MNRHWLNRHKEVALAPPYCLRKGELPVKPTTNCYLAYTQNDTAVNYDDDESTKQEDPDEDDTKVDYWRKIYKSLQLVNSELHEWKLNMKQTLNVKTELILELTAKLEMQVEHSNKL